MIKEQAFLFPGQGDQAVGMGREICEAYPAARYVFQEADDALGKHLSTLMFEGPDDELMRTENAQPALVTASMAVARVLEERIGTPLWEQATFLAGYSVGEYTALAAAGAMSFTDAVRLVHARGRLVQEVSPRGVGEMRTVIGLTLEELGRIAYASEQEGETCVIAADNAPTEQVISGHRASVGRAGEAAREAGARAVVALKVTAPFHSPLLEPAAERLEHLLEEVEIVEAQVPVVANATATPQRMPEGIRRNLVEQLTKMIRWRETVLFLHDRTVERSVELGPSTVLSRLMQRNVPSILTHTVGTPRELEAYMESLVAQQAAATE